jgi:hypothetical protein
MPVEIFITQGGWASISKVSVMVSFKWFTIESCKSDLVKQFENEVSPFLSLPDFDPSLTTYIRDSMALVQCMDAKKHGYDFTRFVFQGCFGIHVFKCFQF